MSRLFSKLEKLCRRGLYFPMALDPNTNKPSITLLIFYTMFIIMMGSLVYTHIYNNYIPSLVTLATFISSFVMYRMRKVDKFKLDVDDGQIELSGDNKNEN